MVLSKMCSQPIVVYIPEHEVLNFSNLKFSCKMIGYDIKPLEAASVASVVRYGQSEKGLKKEAHAEALTYDQLYPFPGLQNYTSGIIHHVRLTEYYYQCGDPSIPAMSRVYSFKTMPISSPKSYPKWIAIAGDLGLTYNTTSTVDHMKRNKPNLFLLVGDITYANLYPTNGTGVDCYSCAFPNTPIHETYQPRWDFWLLSRWEMDMAELRFEVQQQRQAMTTLEDPIRKGFGFDKTSDGQGGGKGKEKDLS